MYSVSARWPTALTTEHQISTLVNVLYGGTVIAENIPFVDGTVTVDRGSAVRRSLSLTIDDPSKFPVDPTDEFAVYGQALYVECGLTYMDKSTERVPMGTFTITDVSGDIHAGPLTISASGPECLLQVPFDTAVSTTGNSSIAAFIEFWIDEVIPGASFVDRSTGGTGPIATATYDAGSAVWDALSGAATAVGAELYADANGTFILADVPNIDTAIPVWTVDTGAAGVMVSATVALSRSNVANRVVVLGENTADNVPPVSGEAKITDTTDPLYYGGPFGKVTQTISSSLVTTSGQAFTAAQAALINARAANRTVQVSAVPNPALDAGDCVRLNYGPGILPELQIVQSFPVPLSVAGGDFTIATLSGKTDTDGS